MTDEIKDVKQTRFGTLRNGYIYIYDTYLHFRILTYSQVQSRERTCRRIRERYDAARSCSTETVQRKTMHGQYHSTTSSRRYGTVSILAYVHEYNITYVHIYIPE